MNLTRRNTEMEQVYSSLIKIFKSKDKKIAEMEVSIIIANQNIKGLNNTLTDKDKDLEKV